MAYLGRAPSQIPGTVGPPFTPRNLPSRRPVGTAVGAFKVVELTEGIYIAAASPALTGQPLWVNISEPGTWR